MNNKNVIRVLLRNPEPPLHNNGTNGDISYQGPRLILSDWAIEVIKKKKQESKTFLSHITTPNTRLRRALTPGDRSHSFCEPTQPAATTPPRPHHATSPHNRFTTLPLPLTRCALQMCPLQNEQCMLHRLPPTRWRQDFIKAQVLDWTPNNHKLVTKLFASDGMFPWNA